jgi:hypothetical protein
MFLFFSSSLGVPALSQAAPVAILPSAVGSTRLSKQNVLQHILCGDAAQTVVRERSAMVAPTATVLVYNPLASAYDCTTGNIRTCLVRPACL